MTGLLDFLKTPEGQGLLAAGLGAASSAGRGRGLLGNLGQGGLMGLQAYGGAQERQQTGALRQVQLDAYSTQAEQRRLALEAEKRKREALPGLFQAPGMAGGEAQPQAMGAGPAQPAQGGGLNWLAALQAGYDPKEIQELQGLTNLGRAKATRQMEVDDGRGGKRIALVDDYGQEVAGFNGYTAPVQVNQGDRVSFVKPAPGVSLGVNMSPEAKASNALGWANHGLTKRGQDLTDARARESNTAGKVPAGYRLSADGQGLEFIPGGPADPNAAKKAAPTEFQGKAAMFGNRAAEADKIITGLDGKYSPSAVNAKKALGSVWGVGGALESVGNAALPENAQKAEQAERDFVNAVLRLESGAAIGKDEFDNARKQYFPQPFDSAAVKKQKAENRQRAIEGLMSNARTSGGTQQPSAGGASGGWSIQKVN
jgi:hypothetical protein